MRTYLPCQLILAIVLCLCPCVLRGQTIDYQRDIQPLLAEKCWHCHGADAATRQGQFRLDDAQAALKGGESGPAIIPGQSKRSLLIERIQSVDADTVMPPPKENKALTANEKKLLAQWIDQGASFTRHWAFEAPVKHMPPGDQSLHPIDAWVVDRLAREGLRPSPAAPAHVLCRRLYLDLVGLPPTPEQVTRFQQVGYDATVQELMASPRFGEKWARHWLDVARYSDTNGYEKDLQRDQWIWRDWVVQALNDDMPYDQFIIEQIAGDLLPGATQSQVIATGFLRNSMLNEEGAIVPEQFRMVEMFDRMDCIGKGILGLSTQCAQCHAHKFDPLSQTEYYGMFAFLNNSYEAQSWVYDAQQQTSLAEMNEAVRRVVAECQEKVPNWSEAVSQWGQQLLQSLPRWEPIDFFDLGSNSGLNHPVQLADQSILMLGHTSADVYMLARPEPGRVVNALQLELLTHGDLPFGGPGRSRTGTWMIHELELFISNPPADAAANDKTPRKNWQKIELKNATADFSEPEVGPPPPAKDAAKDAPQSKKRTGPVTLLVDGSDETSWKADRGGRLRNTPGVAVIQLAKPLEITAGTQLKVALRMGDMPGCIRLSTTSAVDAKAPASSYAAVLALMKPAAERTEDDLRSIEWSWIESEGKLAEQAKRLRAELTKAPSAMTSVLHLKERPASHQRLTHFLDRGNWDAPQQAIQPHTPAAFHPIDGNAPKNRLTFARWLVDRRSPLAARVAVNRVWQAMFGEGLVETAEDFGTRAVVPEYRELLDWLAVDFMDGAHDRSSDSKVAARPWSQKRLIQLIVSSDTYKQTSVASETLLEKDPRNRLLTRGPRFRVEGEVLRDIALSVSGLMTHKLGGPSVIPPVPQNVLDYNYVYPGYWKPATGAERYRRTLYGFRKRSMPDPVMSVLDAPNGDLSCARRVRSNTPLAALAGLNETIFYESAQSLGMRIVREGGSDDRSRIDYAFELCVSRSASPAEHSEMNKMLAAHRKRLADGWVNPREILTGDAAQLPELREAVTPQDAAAWVLAARALLNLDETMTKN